jgi:hypothetical protein
MNSENGMCVGRAPSRSSSALRGHMVMGVIAFVAAAVASLLVVAPARADVTAAVVGTDGRCLDSNWNGKAYVLTCNGGSFQKWRLAGTGITDTYQLINVQTGRCLDSNGNGDVYTLPCNGGSFQKWKAEYKLYWSNYNTGRRLGRRDDGSLFTWQGNYPETGPYSQQWKW